MGLSKITGIKLKGANFETETSLQLLVANKEPALGMLYGKNGAGKSTISRAFSKVSGKVEETIENASVIDAQGNEQIRELRNFLPLYFEAVKYKDGVISKKGGVGEFLKGNGGGFEKYEELTPYKSFYNRDVIIHDKFIEGYKGET